MSFLKPFTTLGVGVAIGYLLVPRALRLLHR
jgi:hypothetical protein